MQFKLTQNKFNQQGTWTTTFLGLPKERFKLVPWRI